MNCLFYSTHRRGIIVLLALLLFLWSDSIKAQTNSAYVVESNDGRSMTFYYDDNREHHTEGKIHDIKDMGIPSWIDVNVDNTTLERVVFDQSFAQYSPLSTAYWFYACTQLKYIEGIDNVNTSQVTSMFSMFAFCDKLVRIDLSHFDTERVTNMSFMFYYCEGLKELNIKSFNTSNVVDMSNMFSDCSSLTQLDVSSFDTSKVEDMNGMFAHCKALNQINLSTFDTSKVTNMSNMFAGTNTLTELDIKHFNTSEVTDMSLMFYNCEGLKQIDLSHFNTSQVTDMSSMFYFCSNLQTIYCNDTWSAEISEEMFAGCEQLKGAVPYSDLKVDVSMANPTTGYFTKIDTAIEEVIPGDAQIVEIYTPEGIRISELQEGVNIVKLSDGSVRKLYIQN